MGFIGLHNPVRQLQMEEQKAADLEVQLSAAKEEVSALEKLAASRKKKRKIRLRWTKSTATSDPRQPSDPIGSTKHTTQNGSAKTGFSLETAAAGLGKTVQSVKDAPMRSCNGLKDNHIEGYTKLNSMYASLWASHLKSNLHPGIVEARQLIKARQRDLSAFQNVISNLPTIAHMAEPVLIEPGSTQFQNGFGDITCPKSAELSEQACQVQCVKAKCLNAVSLCKSMYGCTHISVNTVWATLKFQPSIHVCMQMHIQVRMSTRYRSQNWYHI
jgi:hypothetical protein